MPGSEQTLFTQSQDGVTTTQLLTQAANVAKVPVPFPGSVQTLFTQFQVGVTPQAVWQAVNEA